MTPVFAFREMVDEHCRIFLQFTHLQSSSTKIGDLPSVNSVIYEKVAKFGDCVGSFLHESETSFIAVKLFLPPLFLALFSENC